jgi:hypothetical protein
VVARFQLPVLEDDLANQMAVTDVCQQLASEHSDTKRVPLLLCRLAGGVGGGCAETAQKGVITKQ